MAKDLVPFHEMLKIARKRTGNNRIYDHEAQTYLFVESVKKYNKNPIRVHLDEPMSDLYDESLQATLEGYLLRRLN